LIKKIKHYLHKYRHASWLLYMLIYFPWFLLLENLVTHYTPVHSPLDNYIPFCEYFIVPYLLWFAYVAVAVVYFLFTDKKGYYQLCAHLFIGMTVFLIICTIWPNGQNLRPIYFERDNIFVDAVRRLYAGDTNTNVFPSIHVYNSVVTHVAIAKSERLKKHKWITPVSLVLTISICLATVFLKQHSVVDVVGGLTLSFFIYKLVYSMDHSYLLQMLDEEDYNL